MQLKMTIIAFVVDTSASMYQRAYMDGKTLTYRDVARQAIERILVARRKCAEGRADRYMLLTFENPPNNVKIGWKESLETFREELKNLQFGTARLDTPGDAIGNTLDFLNRNRLRSGIDTFGRGRFPFNLEPAAIVILSDGIWPHGTDPVDIIQNSTDEFVKERYRWDQKVFFVGLRIPGACEQPTVGGCNIPHDDLMEQTCRLTRGRSYSITSCNMLQSCMQNLLEHLSPGVVLDITFPSSTECQQDVASQREKCFVAVQKQNGSDGRTPGFWPIPESYRPNIQWEQLPPRDAHPQAMVAFEPSDEPNIPRGFPVDQYNLGTCSLASLILMKTSNARKVWPIFLNTGRINEKPFGYLKSDSSLMTVKVFVLPYNYPELLPLFGDLIDAPCGQPTPEWLNQFSSYLDTVPKYYCPYLRRMFGEMMKMPQPLVQRILPNHLDHFLSRSVKTDMQRTQKIAKKEQHQFSRHLLKQLETPKHNGRGTEVLPLVNSVFTSKSPYLVPRRFLIDVLGKTRDRFFHPSSSAKVEQILSELSPKKMQSVIEHSPYHSRMRNKLMREAGPISKNFVFKRPTHESEQTTGDDEKSLVQRRK